MNQAVRKAPADEGRAALGFRREVTKLLVIVQLLLGDIPERATFDQPVLRRSLQPYLALTTAVRLGDLLEFEKTVTAHAAMFKKDKTHTLILRLGHNVIKTGLRKISLSYSRISLAEIAGKLHLGRAGRRGIGRAGGRSKERGGLVARPFAGPCAPVNFFSSLPSPLPPCRRPRLCGVRLRQGHQRRRHRRRPRSRGRLPPVAGRERHLLHHGAPTGGWRDLSFPSLASLSLPLSVLPLPPASSRHASARQALDSERTR